MSSAYLPQSNGRAEVAVKATKRLLEGNMNSDGSINNDAIVRALLQLRNTPDRDCRLSPAEVLFGRKLKDVLPHLDKSRMVFENSQVHDHWHEAWRAKEEAIRKRLVRSAEKLEEHTKELEPLSQGDLVFIQNQDQSSRDYKKWNRQGTIVTAGKNDQYLVKVHGTGRLTVRNRRFLRKYTLRPSFVAAEPDTPKISSKDLLKPNIDSKEKCVRLSVSDQTIQRKSPLAESNFKEDCSDSQLQDDASSPKVYGEEQSKTAMEPENDFQIVGPSSPSPPADTEPMWPATMAKGVLGEETELRRSTRLKKPTKFYDPSSGLYKNVQTPYRT